MSDEDVRAERLAYVNGRIAQLNAELAGLNAERRAATSDHNEWGGLSRGERKNRKATVRHASLEAARKNSEVARLLRERHALRPVVAQDKVQKRDQEPTKALDSVRKWINEL